MRGTSIIQKLQYISIVVMHHDKSIDNNANKSTIVKDYNMSRWRWQFVQAMYYYSTARKTHRWPMRILFALLDIAGVNTHILYNSFRDNANFYSRSDFIKDL